jgi:hypothetical protein
VIARQVARDSVKRILCRVARLARVGTFAPLGLTIRLYGDTDKYSHGYSDGYATHFRSRRRRQERLLEIGVGGYELRSTGGSLRVWRDYFPKSQIVGFDLHDKDVVLGPRVKFVRGDQTSERDLARAIAALGGAPSIVIDDGSHYLGHAWTSFSYLFPLMPPGSIYVIEDLHTSYWDEFAGDISAPDATAIGLVRSLIESVQAGDPTFAWQGAAPGPIPRFDGVASFDLCPGIVFIRKAG